MKYKALFLDLDGTTIPNKFDGMPSARVREAIHKAKGHVFVCIATSRPLRYAKPVLDHLDIRGLCVVNDATQIYDPVKKKIVETIYLDPADAMKLRKYFKRYAIPLITNTSDGDQKTGVSIADDHICALCVSDVSLELADRIIADVTKYSGVAAHKIYSWTRKDLYWVSLTHVRATKLHSVVRIAELLGVKTEEMIGVGDGYNDYPLLSACGLKIAMGNAAPELKAIADFIAPSVEEDGVATVIEKFILV